GADAVHGYAVIAGEDRGARAVEARARARLPAGEEDGDVFQSPQRSGGLGQRHLARAGGLLRFAVDITRTGERGLEIRDRGKGGHSATNPGGGTRTRKCPFTPSGQSA